MLGQLHLKDMKRTRAEIVEDRAELDREPAYSYGLQINLDEDELEKLGLERPDVGDMYLLAAIVRVTSASEHQREDGTSEHVCLQIEQMSLNPGQGE